MNRMCVDCTTRGVSCDGTENQTWTGCIYRTTSTQDISCAYIPIISRDIAKEKGVHIEEARKYLKEIQGGCN